MDDVFTVLADPTRRRILDALQAGERSVGQLVEKVSIHQPGVSRHLRILKEAGMVNVRRDAQRRLYSVRPQGLRPMDDWLHKYRDMWESRFDRLETHLKSQEDAP